mmetsp:Transcript_11605/g.28599  ORF Transcript_11605/g.28599 Transcript_11605/m.28599 type:complete len:331 (+) Transcript_11605:600-1592(+)
MKPGLSDCRFMVFMASRVEYNVPRRFVFTISWSVLREESLSSSKMYPFVAALQIHISIPPQRDVASAESFSRSAALTMSHLTPSTSPFPSLRISSTASRTLSSFRDAIRTLSPLCKNLMASARPSPFDPPVMTIRSASPLPCSSSLEEAAAPNFKFIARFEKRWRGAIRRRGGNSGRLCSACGDEVHFRDRPPSQLLGECRWVLREGRFATWEFAGMTSSVLKIRHLRNRSGRMLTAGLVRGFKWVAITNPPQSRSACWRDRVVALWQRAGGLWVGRMVLQVGADGSLRQTALGGACCFSQAMRARPGVVCDGFESLIYGGSGGDGGGGG